jgi:hypothetical protein
MATTDPFGKNTFGTSSTFLNTPTTTDLSKQKGATRYVADASNMAGGKTYYNPTGSGWQEINEGMLGNPDVAKAVMRGAADTRGLYMQPGGVQASNAWSALQNKINPSVIQGIQGSTHSLAPEVLAKMWK